MASSRPANGPSLAVASGAVQASSTSRAMEKGRSMRKPRNKQSFLAKTPRRQDAKEEIPSFKNSETQIPALASWRLGESSSEFLGPTSSPLVAATSRDWHFFS